MVQEKPHHLTVGGGGGGGGSGKELERSKSISTISGGSKELKVAIVVHGWLNDKQLPVILLFCFFARSSSMPVTFSFRFYPLLINFVRKLTDGKDFNLIHSFSQSVSPSFLIAAGEGTRISSSSPTIDAGERKKDHQSFSPCRRHFAHGERGS